MSQFPLQTSGQGVATQVALTGLGVVQSVPATVGKNAGVPVYKLTLPIGAFSQVTALPVDVSGNAVNPLPGSSTTSPATPQATHLATAANFAVLAASAVTGSAGAGSVVSGGNVGIDPTALTAVTNFPPSSVTPPGSIIGPNSVTLQAQNDLTAAINYYNSLASSGTVAGDNLSTSTVGGGGAGVYHAGVYDGGALDIPTSITLDAQGNTAAVFVFRAASTLTLESGANVILANGAQAGNVYWVVGSSATTVWNGIQSNMVGTIMAADSISLGGGNLNGRALASTAAVTMATTEVITVPVLLLIPGTTIPGVTVPFGMNAITHSAAPQVGTAGNIAGTNANPAGQSWFKPSNSPSYANVYIAPAVVDDNDSNPWTVRARSAGQCVIEFQIPTFENAEPTSLVDTNNEMDETPNDSISALLVVTVTGGSSYPFAS